MTTLSPLSPPCTVSVVVPARDAGSLLPRAVASALDQSGPTIASLEVVIAVGPSTDDTRDVARRLALDDKRIRVVTNASGTTPDGLNAAIIASTGQVVVRCDAQSVLPPGYVDHAVRVLDATGSANVGGMQVPTAAGDGFRSSVAAAMRSSVGAGGASYRVGGEPGPVDTVYLGVFHRGALEAVAGYDPVLERNQDYELNQRLRGQGWQVWFDPELQVTYTPRATIQALARQYWDYGRWKRFVVSRDPSSIKLRQMAPPVLVGGLGVAAFLAILFQTLPLLLLLGAWLAVLVYGAVTSGAAPKQYPQVIECLAVMHLAWGAGFIRGGAGPRDEDHQRDDHPAVRA